MALREVRLPDIGDFHGVDVIEVLAAPGATLEKDASLITLESEKATMEVPSPFAGRVTEIKVKVGDKVSQGDLIALMEVAEEAAAAAAPAAAPSGLTPQRPAPESVEEPAVGAGAPQAPAASATAPSSAPPARPAAPPPPAAAPAPPGGVVHASPSVRRFARELGVDLGRVSGTGPKGRILKQDVQGFVKAALRAGPAAAAGGLSVAPLPEIDFARFGAIELQPLTRIQRISGANLHRNWVTIPHVTQHDEADVTELEAFRQGELAEAQAQGIKLTPLAFFLKAAVVALKAFPTFNASLHANGEQLVLKKYFHIGVAVDTSDGLVVPVIRDVDKKGVFELARELGEVSARARDKKLPPAAMQGGCFSISSLGGIGGTGFTPIINAPEVAILGVSRAVTRPVYRDGRLEPRLIVPLSLSFDHRVNDGAAAVRFTRYLSEVLSDIRRLLL